MADPIILDFGNGIITDGVRAGVGLDAIGLEAPEIDIPIAEYGVMNGGMVGAPRAQPRQLTIPIQHERVWTRDEINRAFAPGSPGAPIMRTLSSPKCSLPYLVRGIIWPKRLSDAKREFTVSLVSPWAYPKGPRQTFGGGGASYDFATTDKGTAYPEYYNAQFSAFGQTITLPNNSILSVVGQRIWRRSGVPATFRPAVWRLVSGSWVRIWASGLFSAPANEQLYAQSPSWVNTTGATVTLLIGVDDVTGVPQFHRGSGDAGGQGYYRSSVDGNWYTDGGSDYAVYHVIGTPSASSTKTSIAYLGDVPTPARVLYTPNTTASTPIISAKTADGAIVSETRVNGSVGTGQLVVIGDDPAERSLTVAGTNRLGWFENSKDWPLVTPATAYLESNITGSMEVSFEPQFMGLI